ncbi:MAG: flagellar export chaperone FliS [Spirochaetales bacterium]|uniref:Flagellar secretion chaperone FliS n=1 Tax=Candidatus Thalassospirochaeta sargassi TaxID=3119039 RepID=A0AAJ1IHC8_9SPIO|nr:flagellar export chaperone FliS [Spirochaetales bacterium]
MSNLNPLNAYRETNIKTASQGKLIIMLYEEAVRQMQIAATELGKEQTRLDTVNNAIIKAQDIITELMVSLDFDKGGEIAKNLYSLYVFFNQQLMQANVQKNAELIIPILDMVKDLKDAWAQVFAKVGNTPNGVPGGVNIAG